jgi:predicted dehydrogenase
MIGTGWGVRVQAPIFKSAGLQITALVGSQLEKTQRLAKALNIPHALNDWRAVLKRDDIHLVSITTPPDLHSEIAIAALAAGKHVLCEKPTALNADQADAMLEAMKAHSHKLALIDHELRFLPSVQLAKTMVARGDIGAVRYVNGQIISNARADPVREWNWWSDKSRGGGLLGALGSHQIDLVRYVLGAEVTAISATLNTFVTPRPSAEGPKAVTSDDAYSMHAHLGETWATLEANFTVRVSDPDTMTFHGTEGSLRWIDGRLYHARPGSAYTDVTPVHTYPPPDKLPGAFAYGTVYLAHALKAYLNGEHDAMAHGATFADGLAIQHALDTARQSNAQGGTLLNL